MSGRDSKGRFITGHSGNPNANKGTSELRIMAEMAQKHYVTFYFNLLKQPVKEIERIAKDPTSSIIDRICAKFLYDLITDKDVNRKKMFFKMIGIDMSSPELNINMNEPRPTEGSTNLDGEVIDVPHGTISPKSIVDAIKRDPLMSEAIDVKIKDADDEK